MLKVAIALERSPGRFTTRASIPSDHDSRSYRNRSRLAPSKTSPTRRSTRSRAHPVSGRSCDPPPRSRPVPGRIIAVVSADSRLGAAMAGWEGCAPFFSRPNVNISEQDAHKVYTRVSTIVDTRDISRIPSESTRASVAFCERRARLTHPFTGSSVRPISGLRRRGTTAFLRRCARIGTPSAFAIKSTGQDKRRRNETYKREVAAVETRRRSEFPITFYPHRS